MAIDVVAVKAQTAAIETDTGEIGTAGAGLTNLGGSSNNWNVGKTGYSLTTADWNVGKTGYSLTATTGLGAQTANITGNLSGSVGSVSGDTKQTADVAALITTVGVAGAGLTNLGASGNDWNTVTPDAAGVAPTATEITADMDANSTQLAAIVLDTGTTIPGTITTAQADLTQLQEGIIYGTVGSTDLATTTCSSNLTGYTADQLIGRTIIFTALSNGPATGEATDITDYVVTNGVLTFTALTLAPENTNSFKIV